MPVLRCGTRGSALARAQAAQVRDALERVHPGLTIELLIVRTTGDRLSEGPLPGGKGLFVKELEDALFSRTIELAVHSMKDMPGALPPGLVIGAVPRRADARDVLVGGGSGGLAGLPAGARIGTASLRRRAQLHWRRPDVTSVFLRGNVDTRLRRWRDGEVDALLLAAAGLQRLGVHEPAAEPIAVEELLPAVGQGALALECRADDAATRERLRAIADPDAEATVTAERSFLQAIGGDCNTPLAAHATVMGTTLRLQAQVLAPDGSACLEASASAPRADSAILGTEVARMLEGQGARRLLGR